MDIFCQKLSDCEESITVIAEIMANKDPIKFKEILNEFNNLGFNKVKDLAKTTLGNASKMTIDGDPLAKLYEAIQIYDQHCADQLQIAKLEFQKGNFIKTQEICGKICMLHPTDTNGLHLLASSYFYREEYDNCIYYLNKLSHLLPNCAEVYNNLGTSYMAKSQFHDALIYFHTAVKYKPDVTIPLFNYAITSIKINENEADDTFKFILKHNPELYVVRYNYGNFLFTINKVDEAKQQFKMIEKDAPDFPNSWISLGNIYLSINKVNKAIICYEKALKIDSTDINTWTNLGRAQLELKNYSSAMNYFQTALKLCPNNVYALKHLAQVYYNQENILLAIETYKKCLELQPNNLDCNLKLGLISLECLENYQEAEKYFKKCLELNPETQIEKIYKNLSRVYHKQGKNKSASEISILLADMYFEQDNQKYAKVAYIYALYLDPENSYGHWKLGLTYYKLGLLEFALSRYRKAIELKPNFPNAYCDCALIYEEKNLPQTAIEYYQMTLKLQPTHFNALHNLILIKQKLGQLDDVVKLYKIMLHHENSDVFEVCVELGNVLYYGMKNLKEAYIYYKKAANMNNTVDINLFIGNLLIEMKRNDDALVYFNKAIELDPQCVIAHTNMGAIYKGDEKFIDAINVYEKILKIKPDFPDAYCNLAQCLQQVCNWSNYDSRILKLKDIINEQLKNNVVPSVLPYYSLLYPLPPEILKAIALKYSEQYVNKINLSKKSRQNYKYPNFLSSNERVRVGYVSDFISTSQLMQSIINSHNRNKIEVFCYSLSSDDSSPSWSMISTVSEHIKDISKLEVVEAADQINKDGIHILINMNGYTEGAQNEIFALRPAPIQVSWFGYLGTSGAPFIDYLITDKVCSPPEHGNFYTEKLAYMNQSVIIGDHKQMFNDLIPCVIKKKTGYVHQQLNSSSSMNKNNVNAKENNLESINTNTSMYSIKTLPGNIVNYYTRQMYNLPEENIVYCNFNQLYKIDPSTLRMWVTILKYVPNSVLWLLRFSDIAADNIRAYAASLNINTSRIIFSTLVPKDEHMRRIQLADIFLDTPLYNGHTTCLDVLWAGIPVVTLSGETFVSRMTASQLTTLGCTNTIAHNSDDYIKIAVNLGINETLLENIKTNIWNLKMTSKLFNCKSYTEELEIIYEGMWNKYLTNTVIS